MPRYKTAKAGTARRDTLSADEIVWQIHVELAKTRKCPHGTLFAVLPTGKGDWTVTIGKAHERAIPSCAAAIRKIGKQFLKKYRLAAD